MNAKLVAGCKDINVVCTKVRWWRDDRHLLHTRCHRGNRRHQDGGWISGSSSWDTDSDSSEWNITLPLLDSRFAGHFNILMENRPLEMQNVVPNTPDALKEFRIRLLVRFFQLFLCHSELVRPILASVDLRRVFKNCLKAPISDVDANLFNNLLGRQRCSKNLDRLFSTRLADHIASWAEFGA